MANYAQLKAAVASVITTNGNNEITGALLNQTLATIIDSLGDGYQFVGMATPETAPGTPDQKVFYIGGAGTYPNFGPAVVPSGSMGIFYYDSSWHVGMVEFPLGDGSVSTSKLADGAVTQIKLATELRDLLLSGYVYSGLATLSTNPGTPTRKCFYIASEAGTYTNFGSLAAEENKLNILRYDGSSWILDVVDFGLEQIYNTLYGSGSVLLDVPGMTSCGGMIDASTLKWNTQYPTRYFGGLIDVSQYRGRKYKIVSSGGGSFAFLKSGVSSNNVADFCSGTTLNLMTGAAGTEFDGVIPDDAVYFYCYLKSITSSTSTDYRPQSVTILPTDSIVQEIADIYDEIDDLMVDVAKAGTVAYPIDVNSISSCGSRIDGTTYVWQSNYTTTYFGGLISAAEFRGKPYRVVSNGGGSFAFLKSGVEIGEVADFCSGTSLVLMTGAAGTVFEGIVPDDAVYFYCYLESPGTNYRPREISFFISVSDAIAQLNQKIDQGGAAEYLSIFDWNIGHFSNGAQKNSTITSAQYAQKVDAFRAILSTERPDFFGIVEYSAVFGKNTNNVDVNTKDELFSFDQTAYESTQMNYSCNALFARYGLPIYNIQINNYDCLENEVISHTSLLSAQDFRYISADMYAFGVTIKVVVTHMAFDLNRPGVLTTNQINELISKYASYPYVLMMGDFNVNSVSEYDLFVNAGYNIANDGRFNTYRPGGTPLDNIVAKGLTIFDAQMLTTDLSDHNALLCKINKADDGN